MSVQFSRTTLNRPAVHCSGFFESLRVREKEPDASLKVYITEGSSTVFINGKPVVLHTFANVILRHFFSLINITFF